MNITTNQNTIRPNAPGFFTLCLDAHLTGTPIELDVNKAGDIVRYGWADSSHDFTKHPINPEITATITEILADIRAGFMWLDALERRTGKHIAECTGSLPCGRWVVIDIGGRCLHLLESPRDESVELPLAVECGV